MGHSISTFFSNIFSKTSYNLVLCGLDGSGKTTILYKMKLGETVYTMPTIGNQNYSIILFIFHII